MSYIPQVKREQSKVKRVRKEFPNKVKFSIEYFKVKLILKYSHANLGCYLISFLSKFHIQGKLRWVH